MSARILQTVCTQFVPPFKRKSIFVGGKERKKLSQYSNHDRVTLLLLGQGHNNKQSKIVPDVSDIKLVFSAQPPLLFSSVKLIALSNNLQPFKSTDNIDCSNTGTRLIGNRRFSTINC